MSRIGNKAVEIPDKVKVNIGDDGAVAVEGPKGKLNWTLPREIKASVAGQPSLVRPRGRNAQCEGAARSFAQPRSQHGVRASARVSPSSSRSRASASRPRCRVRISISASASRIRFCFRFRKDIKITVTDNTKIAIQGIDKKSRRPGRGRHSPLLPAGTLQGQRRALRRRTDSPQGRQDRSIVMATTIVKTFAAPHSQADHGSASAARRNVRVWRFIFPGNMFMRRSSTTTRAGLWSAAGTTEEGFGRTRQSGGQSRVRGKSRQSNRRALAREESRQGRFRSRWLSLSRQSESSGRRGARRRTQILEYHGTTTQAGGRRQRNAQTRARRQRVTRPRKSCSSIAAPKS